MKIGPRYKIAKRLGAPVFEKTQTQKYAIRTGQGTKKTDGSKSKSDYGLGMQEKQKARFTYGISAKQFAKYVKNAIDRKGNSSEILITSLESRIDNVALRSGFANTRQAARQMASHGHLTINGSIIKTPSHKVKVGDVISIREGSKNKGLFKDLDTKLKSIKLPAWLKLDFDKKTITVDGVPTIAKTELFFDPDTVIGFYSR